MRHAKELSAQGYKAVKVHPFLNHTLEQASNTVAMVRTALGPGFELMVHLNSKADTDTALRFADMIAPHAPYWFEEPTDGADVDVLAEVARRTPQLIVTGKRQCSVVPFKAILRAGAADILNPVIASLGGILDMLRLADLADENGISLSPHCWNSMIIAASDMLHVCAAIPNAEKAEIYREYIAHGAQFASVGYTLNGANATPSNAHGLGIKIDTKAAQTFASSVKESHFGHQMARA